MGLSEGIFVNHVHVNLFMSHRITTAHRGCLSYGDINTCVPWLSQLGTVFIPFTVAVSVGVVPEFNYFNAVEWFYLRQTMVVLS